MAYLTRIKYPLSGVNYRFSDVNVANFNEFCVLGELLHGTLVVGVSQTAAWNRGLHPE